MSGKRNVKIAFREGVQPTFTEVRNCEVVYAQGWLIVTDEYGDAMAWPFDTVRSVNSKPTHYDRGS